MAHPSIQNQLLEITVVGCSNLPQSWAGINANHPYICLQYGGEKFRTRSCLGGGENPKFADEFKIQLIEGIRKIKVQVMNSNSFTADNIIGCGNDDGSLSTIRIYLHKVLHVGYDSKTWPLLSKSCRQAGEVKVIMHYENVEKHILPNLPCPRCANYIHEQPMYYSTKPGHFSSDRDLVPQPNLHDPYCVNNISEHTSYSHLGHPTRDIVPQPNLQYPMHNSSQLGRSTSNKDFVQRPASTGNMLTEQEKVDRRWENLKYYSQIRDYNHVL